MRALAGLMALLALLQLLPPLAADSTLYSFQEWKARFNISYPNATEDARRQAIFDAKVLWLQNSDCDSCGLTKFSADTPEECSARTNLLLPPDIREQARQQRIEDQRVKVSSDGSGRLKLGSPNSLDWRDQGAVTPVKAQGSCGTCWSFATVAMCESSLVLQGKAFNNRLYSVDLSQQYLLKCTPGSSCNGGYLENSIDKALEKGLPYESEFGYSPYSANNNGICSTSDLIVISNATRLSKYYVTDDAIITLLLAGPVALAISATGWESYSSGVYRCPVSAPINHAVLLVGYTPDYWIIKNSWGTDWGVSGFIYVTRNSLYNCGIGTAVHSLWECMNQAVRLLLAICLLLFLIF